MRSKAIITPYRDENEQWQVEVTYPCRRVRIDDVFESEHAKEAAWRICKSFEEIALAAARRVSWPVTFRDLESEVVTEFFASGAADDYDDGYVPIGEAQYICDDDEDPTLFEMKWDVVCRWLTMFALGFAAPLATRSELVDSAAGDPDPKVRLVAACALAADQDD